MSYKDNNLKKFVGDIEKKEKEGKSIDKSLLEKAKECEIIDEIEYSRLEYIWKMRGIYAHPYNKEPTLTELKAAIEIGVNSVLSKPPLLSYGYVKKLIDDISNISYLIEDDREKIRNYVKKNSRFIRPEVYSYVFKLSCEKIENLLNDWSRELILRRLVIFNQEFFNSVSIDNLDDSWQINDYIRDYPISSCEIISLSKLWYLIDNETKDLIIRCITENISKKYPIKALNILSKMEKMELLNDYHKKKFLDLIQSSSSNYSYLIQSDIHFVYYVDRIINDLKSYNWYIQNPAGEALMIIPFDQFNNINDNKLEELGRNILQASEGKSTKVLEFLEKLSKESFRYPPALIRGVIYELFINDNNKFRLKIGNLLLAIGCLINTNENYIHNILKETIERISESDYKNDYYFSKDEAEEIKEYVNDIISKFLCKDIKKPTRNKLILLRDTILKKVNERIIPF